MKMWKEACKLCSHWHLETHVCYWHQAKYYKESCLHQNKDRKTRVSRTNKKIGAKK